jgi:A/G-specific adenine glycosylase
MSTKLKLTPSRFQQLLLNWFDDFGRKDLPWQQNKSPYRVWVSEIMLQQTQVSTVIHYFDRFMQRFPTIEKLATAAEDEVLHLWTGLGYYNRARNLQKAAKMLVQEYQGKFPEQISELEKLPGIGRSTAGAILSIAFNQPAAILDGNVKRVLTRLHGITEWPGTPEILTNLWSIAEKYSPHKRTADYTQAIMDLGATLCVRGKPRCTECPYQPFCIAYQQGIEKNLPLSKPRKTLPIRQVTFLILQKLRCILLEKRPPTGVWASLWGLPEINGSPDIKEIRKACKQRYQLDTEEIKLGEPFRHTFSHFHLEIVPAFISVNKASSKIMEDNHQIWYNLKHSQTVGLPAPVKKLLKNLEKNL